MTPLPRPEAAHDAAAVALGPERVRGAVEAEFACADGAFAPFVRCGGRSGRRLADREGRLDAPGRGRRPLPSPAAPTGLLAPLTAIHGTFAR
ncbi:hypothetical protein [Streptomyces sp. NPDC002537]